MKEDIEDSDDCTNYNQALEMRGNSRTAIFIINPRSKPLLSTSDPTSVQAVKQVSL